MKYWLAVSSYSEKKDYLERYGSHFWCFPLEASPGDKVFLYCSRSSSIKEQGIYAICQLSSHPEENHQQNNRCSAYIYKGKKLKYVDIALIESFKKHLVAKELKNNIKTRNLAFVRRNFQGTIFELEESSFNEILTTLKLIN